jgi:hypothetical protein
MSALAVGFVALYVISGVINLIGLAELKDSAIED